MTDSPRDTRPAPLSLRLFGPFAVAVAGRPIARLRSRKGYWILALLALRAGSAVGRDWLAGTLWPETEEEKALYSLRRSLADLRRALGDEAWRIEAPTPRTLLLNLEGADADIRTFDQSVTQATPGAWERAVSVYAGPLLEGCLEEWVFQERDALEEAYLSTLERLAAEAVRRGETAPAVGWLRRAVATAPFRETAQRALMEALATRQDFAGVMLAYHELRSRLHRDLNAAPDPETTALMQQIRREARRRGERVTATREATLTARNGSVPSQEGQTAAELILPDAPRRLPQPRTSFVGQEYLLAELSRLLPLHRLVTLTGAGGIGKTRLAIQAALEAGDLFPGGTWLVDLAPLRDPALVLDTVARTLAVSADPGRSLLDSVTEFLNGSFSSPRPAGLLIVDNCEHLSEECSSVVETLLRDCPGLHVLATSRQALGLSGEMRRRVPSLPTPSPVSPACSAAEIAALPDAYPALRLFIDRAQSCSQAFTSTQENVQVIVRICRLLEGIPLAIELAAARVRAMSLRSLADRLDDRFQLLVGEDRTGPPRHHTLYALIAWSVDMLSPAERSVLCHLAVFRDGWTLEAAEAVCTADVQQNAVQNGVLDLLTSLVDKSLVLFEIGLGEGRYRLLEAVRQYVWQFLLEASEGVSIQERFCRYCLSLVHKADAGLTGPEQTHWLTVLERERHNLDEALLWTAETPGRQVEGIELAGLLGRFWLTRGYWTEGRKWLGKMLRVPLAGDGPEIWTLSARAYNGIGTLAWAQGDYAAAQEGYEQGLEAWHRAGDVRGQAAVLSNMGVLALQQNDRIGANRLGERSLELRRQIGDQEGIASSLTNLGMIAWQDHDYAKAVVCYAESLTIRRKRNDSHGIATCLNNLALVSCDQKDFARADALFAEGEAMFRALEDRKALALILHSRAEAAYLQQEDGAARTLLEESITLFRSLGEQPGLSAALLLLAQVARRQGNDQKTLAILSERTAICLETRDCQAASETLEQMAEVFLCSSRLTLAVYITAAVAAWRSDANRGLEGITSMRPGAVQRKENRRADLTAKLGEQAFADAWKTGSLLTLDQVLTLTQIECTCME